MPTKKKVVKKTRKKKAPRKKEGYILLYKRKTGCGYYAKSEIKVVICETEADVVNRLGTYAKDFVGKKVPKFNRSLSTCWATPDKTITVIKGEVLSPKLSVNLDFSV